MKSRKFRRIWGQPWDYCYLLELEQYKLKEMSAYFKKSQLTVGWEFQVRDIELCIKLIDIILEKDQYYRSWLHNCYGSIPHKQLPFPVYVNSKNCKRFMPLLDSFKENNVVLRTGLYISLRQKKALYLYNKIRAYRMEHWWD
jgi:hypothetical protein